MAELGSKMEAQEAPKSRPRREKIDVKNQYVFRIDLLVVQTSFWEGFLDVFWRKNARKLRNYDFCETLENIDFT